MMRTDTAKQKAEIAEFLRERRAAKKLSQQKVAEDAGIALKMYSRFELGERNLATASYWTASKIFRVLEVDMTEFVRRFLEGGQMEEATA